MGTMELAAIDLRYEHTRQRDEAAERRLMASIMEQDIQEPLSVAYCTQTKAYVLLDGFKRYRCARKLGMGMVPAECIAGDIVSGLLYTIRQSWCGGELSCLEQAALIEELHKEGHLSIYDIATRLGRSPSWVSMRLGMLEQLSPLVRRKIMSGAFPLRAYMYGIKGFTRVNKVTAERIDLFVEAVSGKRLSTRELFVLCRSFLKGAPLMDELILRGDIHRAVALCMGESDEENVLSGRQRSFVADLRESAVCMERVISSAAAVDVDSGYFAQSINHWTSRIRACRTRFREITDGLHDRCRPPDGGLDAVRPGRGEEGHCTAVEAERQDGPGDNPPG